MERICSTVCQSHVFACRRVMTARSDVLTRYRMCEWIVMLCLGLGLG